MTDILECEHFRQYTLLTICCGSMSVSILGQVKVGEGPGKEVLTEACGINQPLIEEDGEI